MSKNLKLSFILNFALACVVIAFKSFSTFFGLGLAFVAVLVLFTGVLILLCLDKLCKTRTLDLFIISAVFTALELIIFFVLEINASNVTSSAIKGFGGFQSGVSVLAVFYFVYVVFRIVTELKGNRVTFVEKMLNKTPKPKEPKKAKELTNGSLMEKPKNKEKEQSTAQTTEKPNENLTNETTSRTNSVLQTEVVVKSNFNDEHSEN